MPDTARFPWLNWIAPLVVLAVALAARAWYLTELCDYGKAQPPLQVQDSRAESVMDQVNLTRQKGEFLGLAPWSETPERTAFNAPGYPYFVFALGHLPTSLEQTVRWVQCGLGALTACCWCILAGWIFRSHLVGLLAGLFCAVNPFWVVNTAQIDDGVLATFLLAVCLLAGSIGSRSGGPFVSLMFGLLLALLALVRAAFLPFAFVAVLWYLWQCKAKSRSWVSAALVFLGFVNGLAPWTVRNYQVFHDFLPVVDSTYYHLWLGNNPQASGGPLPAEMQTLALVQQKDQDADRAAREMYVMDENLRYDSLAPYVYREVMREPARTLQRRLWAGLCFWFGQDVLEHQGAAQTSADQGHWLVRSWPGLAAGTLLGMFLLALIGWRGSLAFARNARLVTLAVACYFLPFLLSHGAAQSGLRLPLDGALLSFAAFGLLMWVPGAVERRPIREQVKGRRHAVVA